MNASAFLDTNILLYAFAENDPRTGIAEDLLSAGARVGVQVLNEFAAVAMRKLDWPLEEISEALLAIRALCPEPVPVTIETHDRALQIVKRYRYHIYDALDRRGSPGSFLHHPVFGRSARRSGHRRPFHSESIPNAIIPAIHP